MPGQQFFYSCVCSLLFARRIVIVVLSQRDIAIAYDEDHAYFNFGEILGALKKGSGSNHHRGCCQARSWPHLERACPSPALSVF